MSIPKMAKAMGYIDDDLVSGAVEYKRTKKKNSWLKWGAMAACLCLVVVGAFIAPNLGDGALDYVETVIYNNAEYVVCGEGEANILKECGLPVEITKELAGEHIGYLEQTEKNTFVVADNLGNSKVELFEYAPQPNDNVYILCVDGEYFAAIRKDNSGYHGLTEIKPAE